MFDEPKTEQRDEVLPFCNWVLEREQRVDSRQGDYNEGDWGEITDEFGVKQDGGSIVKISRTQQKQAPKDILGGDVLGALVYSSLLLDIDYKTNHKL